MVFDSSKSYPQLFKFAKFNKSKSQVDDNLVNKNSSEFNLNVLIVREPLKDRGKKIEHSVRRHSVSTTL
jgi:hypothetical protein